MRKTNVKAIGCGLAAAALCQVMALTARAQAGIDGITDAFNYGVMFEGAGGNKLNINNGPGINGLAMNGNIGIGGTGVLQMSGPLTIDGNVDFAGANNNSQGFGTGSGPFVNGNVTLNGAISANVTAVQTTLNQLNTLSANLGAEAGTGVAISTGGGSQTINANNGILDGSGNRVFTVTGVSFGNNQTLNINGTAGQYVVFNISASAGFNGGIMLTGGITSDHVIFNFVGGSGLTGGPTFSASGNFGGTGESLTGIFLDPNGTIQLNNTEINGRVFGGDTHDEAIVSGALINAPVPTVPDGATTALLLAMGVGAIVLASRGFQKKAVTTI